MTGACSTGPWQSLHSVLLTVAIVTITIVVSLNPRVSWHSVNESFASNEAYTTVTPEQTPTKTRIRAGDQHRDPQSANSPAGVPGAIGGLSQALGDSQHDVTSNEKKNKKAGLGCSVPLNEAIMGLSTALLNASLQGEAPDDTVGVFFSPLSLFYALTLALNGAGAGSDTHKELLGLLTSGATCSSPKAGSSSQAASLALEGSLNSQLSSLSKALSTPKPVIPGVQQSSMVLANAVFTQPGFSPNTEYAATMQALFNATAQTASDVAPINAWVKKQTKGLIPNVLPDGSVFDAVLVNALYFKGLWRNPFEKHLTAVQPFTSPKGTSQVTMMNGVFYDQQIVSVEGVYDALLLPYKGSQYSAILVLPAPGVSLIDAFKAWSSGKGKTVTTAAEAHVAMPKFQASSGGDVADTLKSVGVKAAFEPTSDFTRLAAKPVLLSGVIHKAVVAVDEAGTEAAAVSALPAVGMGFSMEVPVYLTFDRPFIFGIQHDATSTLVFVGAVHSPPAPAAPAHRRLLRGREA